MKRSDSLRRCSPPARGMGCAAAFAPASIEEDRPKRYVTARDHSRFVALAG